jgi:hypothetical protein
VGGGARFSAPVQTGPGAHTASCTMSTGSFPGVNCGRGVLLTPQPLLVPRSGKSRAIPPPTLRENIGPVTGLLHFTKKVKSRIVLRLPFLWDTMLPEHDVSVHKYEGSTLFRNVVIRVPNDEGSNPRGTEASGTSMRKSRNSLSPTLSLLYTVRIDSETKSNPCTGPEGSRRWKLPEFLENLHITVTRLSAFIPQAILLILISVRELWPEG